MIVRKLPAVIVLAAGLAMIVLPPAFNSFTTANQAQQLLDGARPIVAPPHLQQQFLAGLQTANQTEQLLTGPGFAQLADDLGETPAQFQAQVATQWPAIARAQQQAPAIDAATLAILTNLEHHQHDFQLADAIPVSHAEDRPSFPFARIVGNDSAKIRYARVPQQLSGARLGCAVCAYSSEWPRRCGRAA